jgi:phage terminase large subunit GpA-like protein
MPASKGRPLTIKGESYSDNDKIKIIMESFLAPFLERRDILLTDWAEKHIRLSSETSSEEGPYRIARSPYVRKIMECLSPAWPTREVVWVKASQVGGTLVSTAWLLYISDVKPGPTLYAQKTETSTKEFSIQKLTAAIKNCKKVYNILGEGKSHKYADSWSDKGYPGGFISLGPANSATFARSKSVWGAVLDEESSFEPNVEGQGSAYGLFSRRLQNFPDSKMFRLSTPGIFETCQITEAYRLYTEEQYYMPCPFCNPKNKDNDFKFFFEWERIKYSKNSIDDLGLPIEVYCECPNCGAHIDENESKGWMMNHGVWLSTKGIDGEILKPFVVDESVERRSFKTPGFYSPVGFYSWRDAVREWYEYKKTKNNNLLQIIVNNVFAEPYKLSSQEIPTSLLLNRREHYKKEVPLGGLKLTCGVDVQSDRLEMEVVAWGLNDENWGIDYNVIVGDPEQLGDSNGYLIDRTPSVWLQLDQYLQRKFEHETGCRMPIECTMIDSGYLGEIVQTFCKPRQHRHIFPVKGQAGTGKGLFQAPKRVQERFKTYLYIAYVDELKNRLYSQLMIDKSGPGFCHFPIAEFYSKKFFDGITSEHREVKMVGGQKKIVWCAPTHGVRNEPIDCRNYATVAHLIYRVDMMARAQETFPLSTPQQIVKKAKRKRAFNGF